MPTSDAGLYYCLPIPDGDYTDVYENQAIVMALVHNIFIRGFNSLLYYSREIQLGSPKLGPFLKYAFEVCTIVHHHHHAEETMYFPFLEARMGVGRMSGNVAGHEAFYKPFGAFEELVEELISHPELWDAEKLRASIHAFMPVLREHLEEEITTLDAAELRKHVTKKDWEEWEKMFMDDHKKNMSFVKGGQLPFINGDSINGDWFPPLPGPLVLLVKYVLYWVHSDWWEFGACDKDKKVKSQFAPYEPPAKVSKL